MRYKHFKNIENQVVKNFGSKRTQVRWWTTKEDSPYFMMRRFEIEPKGHIGIHSHEEEHQMFVLRGPINLIDEKGKLIQIEENNFVYMPPNEKHGYKNPNDYSVSFVCCIPNLNKN